MTIQSPPAEFLPTAAARLVMTVEEVTDPGELAASQLQRARFKQNWDWFTLRAVNIYRQHRGKYLCVAGQELFVGDTPDEAIYAAKAAHPADDGRFTRFVPQDMAFRIYEN